MRSGLHVICCVVNSFIVAVVMIAAAYAQSAYDDDSVLPSDVDTPESLHELTNDGPSAIPEPLVPAMIPISPAVTGTPPAGLVSENDFFQRTTISGDWRGFRPQLKEAGITLDLSTTQYYQGIAAGGLQQGFAYGGRNDYFLTVDGERLGMWEGLSVSLHGESRYGDTIDRMTGAFMPTNLMLDVPQNFGSVTALTAVKVTQFLTENSLIYAGRLNMFDSFSQPITGATALNGFLNTAMMFNPVYGRTVPYSTYGAGYVHLLDSHPLFSVSVINTANTPTVSGFDQFFTNGATVLGVLNLPTNFFELPGHQGVSGTYSSGKFSDLEPTAYYDPSPAPGLLAPKSAGSWCFAYNFDQALYASPGDSKKIWGVFANAGFSDGNPNAVQRFWNMGVNGVSPVSSRPQDSFGIGYYYLDVADAVKDVAPSVLRLHNEQGLELYYNVAVTPWFHVTPDIQVVDPFKQRADNALVAGLRGKIDF